MKVTMVAAATLCGRIGPLPVGSSLDRERLTGLRENYDASIIGAGTLRAEDPCLLAGEKERFRCLVTGSGDIPVEKKRFFLCGHTPVVFTCSSGVDLLHSRLRGRAEMVVVPERQGELQWEYILDWLAEKGVRSLLLEGGGRLNHSALAQGVVDELEITIAPRLSGDRKVPSLCSGPASLGLPFLELELLDCSVKETGELFLHYRVKNKV